MRDAFFMKAFEHFSHKHTCIQGKIAWSAEASIQITQEEEWDSSFDSSIGIDVCETGETGMGDTGDTGETGDTGHETMLVMMIFCISGEVSKEE